MFTKILKSITVLQTDYHDLLKAHTLTLSMVWGGKTSPAHYFELKYGEKHSPFQSTQPVNKSIKCATLKNVTPDRASNNLCFIGIV